MRIAYLAAGAGLTYCGACIRDLALVAGLRNRGHDVDLLALYTPLKGDVEHVADTASIHFGGINVFLQQAVPFFRRTSLGFDSLMDSQLLLNLASHFAVRTTPESLGPMTVSMLAGRDGRQSKEVAKLMLYFQRTQKPDLLNITNSLLSGIAPDLRKQLKAPIVCNVQGEDSFLAGIPEPYYSQSLQLMRRNARAVDLFISPNEDYARRMIEMLQIPGSRMRVARVGIEAGDFARTAPRPRSPLVIGYLSIIARRKGLDILIDAVARLVNQQERDVALHVAGRVAEKDYWNEIRRTVAETGLESRINFVGELDLRGKVEFLRRCSVFSVPSRVEESRGMAIMEAMAAGLPVVAPGSGVFKEMVGDTGAGALHVPGDAASLAGELARLIDEPERADKVGAGAAEVIASNYTTAQMIDGVEDSYRRAMSGATIK